MSRWDSADSLWVSARQFVLCRDGEGRECSHCTWGFLAQGLAVPLLGEDGTRTHIAKAKAHDMSSPSTLVSTHRCQCHCSWGKKAWLETSTCHLSSSSSTLVCSPTWLLACGVLLKMVVPSPLMNVSAQKVLRYRHSYCEVSICQLQCMVPK